MNSVVAVSAVFNFLVQLNDFDLICSSNQPDARDTIDPMS